MYTVHCVYGFKNRLQLSRQHSIRYDCKRVCYRFLYTCSLFPVGLYRISTTQNTYNCFGVSVAFRKYSLRSFIATVSFFGIQCVLSSYNLTIACTLNRHLHQLSVCTIFITIPEQSKIIHFFCFLVKWKRFLSSIIFVLIYSRNSFDFGVGQSCSSIIHLFYLRVEISTR